MPKAHRETDKRFCSGSTVVTNQDSVFVNGLLWSVEGDKDDHIRGDLVCVGERSVYIHGIPVITAVKDIAVPDLQGHPTGPVNPASGSDNVFAY